MRNAAGQLPHGFHLLRLPHGRFSRLTFGDGICDAFLQGAVQLLKCRFRILACGYIDGRSDQADHFPRFIQQRCFDRKPHGGGAVRFADVFLDLFDFAAAHDALVSLHDLARLGLVIEKFQIGFADIEAGRLADQLSGAGVGHQHATFQILRIDDTRYGC